MAQTHGLEPGLDGRCPAQLFGSEEQPAWYVFSARQVDCDGVQWPALGHGDGMVAVVDAKTAELIDLVPYDFTVDCAHWE